jgi:uncharacterized membrane protein YbhN (UPF0104 family)
MTDSVAVDTPTPAPRVGKRRWRVAGLSIFSSNADAPRARRPADIVLLALGSLVLIAVAVLAPGPTSVGADVARLLREVPSVVGWLWQLGYDLLLLWALFLAIACAVHRGRRRVVVEQLLAAAMGLAFAVVIGFAAGSSLSQMRHELLSSHKPGAFPATRVAVLAAVVLASSPHLVRPLRVWGRWLVALAAVASVALDLTTGLGAIAGVAAAVVGAAVVHLILGSPGGRPPRDEVAEELADLGLAVTDIQPTALQRRGVALSTAHGPDGAPLLVRMYGRDAWEGQLISSWWTRLWYRAESPSTRVGRLQQVEHEAFVTLLAERADVPVLPVVVAGLVWDRDAVLVTAADARPVARLAGGDVGDAFLRACWDALTGLHHAGISHGDLNADSVMVTSDRRVVLTDLARANTSPSDAQLATDRVQMLVTTALLVGPQRAVAVALDCLGTEALTGLVPYLQPPVLSLETRRAVRSASWGMADLRKAATAATGAEPPKLQQLHRVTVGSIVLVAVIVLVAYAVITAIAGIGFSTLVDEFKSANLWWTAGAFATAPIIPLGFAIATIGASTREVRFGPILALEYAIQFLALAVPSTAAKLALEVRFFERFGIAATGAIAIGLIDSVSGFVVQILLILVLLLSGLVTLSLSAAEQGTSTTQSSSSGSIGPFEVSTLLWIAGVLVVVLLVVLVSVPRVRRFVAARAADSRVALRVLRSPRKVGQLLSGNLVAQALQALALALCVEAFGFHISFAAAVVVNTGALLFGGLMPVPGGVGVVEAALSFGLVSVGVPHTAAVSAALMYRLVTFYLPPIWGGFAMRWLRAHEYV